MGNRNSHSSSAVAMVAVEAAVVLILHLVPQPNQCGHIMMRSRSHRTALSCSTEVFLDHRICT